MIPEIGHFALILALCVAVVQGVVPRPLVRRLMVHIPINSISWEYCNIVEADPQRRLRLNISTQALETMHPADLADIVEELSGNLCRCTGYAKIVAAVRRTAAEA